MIALIERADRRIRVRGCVAEMAGDRLHAEGEGPCVDAYQQALVAERLLADVAEDVVARRLRLE